LAEQEPAPQLPSLPVFFFLVVVAGLPSLAAAGVGVAAGAAAGVAAGMAAGVAGVLAAVSVGLAAAPPAGATALPLDAGEVAAGVEPPHAATPRAAAANPKIRFRRVMSIAWFSLRWCPFIAPLATRILRALPARGFAGSAALADLLRDSRVLPAAQAEGERVAPLV
jgi:hypothetical protein